MIEWKRRERWHLKLDASLRRYLSQIVHVVDRHADSDVLDVAAGSGWLGQLPFRSYHPVDIIGSHEHWDIDTPLADHHVGQYDLVVCLGALHFAHDPRWSLGQLVRAVRPTGELLVAVPWVYPPHDLPHDRWRLAPRQIWRMASEHFDQVELHPHGSFRHLPMHILNRYVTGPFRGVPREDLERLRAVAVPEPWRPERVEDVPVLQWGPMGVLAHAARLRG